MAARISEMMVTYRRMVVMILDVDVTGRSAFDYDGQATCTGGTIIVNGQQVNGIPNQMMGGGMMGGMPGGGRGWNG